MEAQRKITDASEADNWLDAKKEWKIQEYVHTKETIETFTGVKTNKVVVLENDFTHQRINLSFEIAKDLFNADIFEMKRAKVRTENWSVAFPHDICYYSASLNRIKELLNDKEFEILSDIMDRGYRIKGKQVNFMAGIYLKCNYNLKMERW